MISFSHLPLDSSIKFSTPSHQESRQLGLPLIDPPTTAQKPLLILATQKHQPATGKMTQLCRKIVQVNLRWSLAEKVTIFRRFFKFIWHRILACSTKPPASPRYTRLSSRRNSSPSSMAAALEYPGCDPSTTSCSGGDSDLVCLKISLLGDCRIGKTSFAIRYVGDLQEQKSLQMKGLNLMDKTFDIGGARIACKLWDVGVLGSWGVLITYPCSYDCKSARTYQVEYRVELCTRYERSLKFFEDFWLM